MPMIDPHIFRAYDIRGKAEAQLTADGCRWIAQAFGTTLRRRYGIDHPTVAVGLDARTHGPGFETAVVAGLMAAGCHVLRIGATPSPVNYFTICERRLDGGIQITASHNPKDDNGLKLQLRDAEAFSGEDLQTLRAQIAAEDVLHGEGSSEDYDALTPYKALLQERFAGVAAGMHIAVDGGNGIAGPTACAVLKALGATVTELFIEPDGTFPNHAADPSKHQTLADLQNTIAEGGIDVGFAFDGDGDRIGIVDDRGQILTADETLLLLARDHLERFPGATVVCTVSNSSTILSEVQAWGGTAVMCKVGHSFVEHAMRDNNALLGGEQSGHFFCGEGYYPYDDALVAGLRILSILHAKGASLSSLRSGLPKVVQAPEMRPHCPDAQKTAIVSQVTAHFAALYPVNTLDGVRVDFGEGAWAGIRQSNTSPCLSICIEARTPEKLAAVKTEVLRHLEAYPAIGWDGH